MRRAVLLLVPLLLLACDRQPVAPDISPTFDIANAPEESGIVVRAEIPTGLGLAYPPGDLYAFIGIDLADFCDDLNFTGELVFMATKNMMEGYRAVALIKGELEASVWRRSEIFAGAATWWDVCDNIAATEPLATGPVSVLYRDNSYVGYEYLTNANPYGWSYHGSLVRPDGTKAAFSGHHFWYWNQESQTQVLRTRMMKLN